MAVVFPSTAFFLALRDAMRSEQGRFQRLGFFDATLGVRVLPDGPGAPPVDHTVDFVLEGPLAAWRDMLDTIHALGAADTAHSINTLTHFGERLRVRYDDPNGHDKLYRFAESIQQFFDLAARIDFAYPDGSRPPARERRSP